MGINSLIYRQICSNGMMGVMAEDSGEVFHKRGKSFNPFAQRTLLHNGLENSLEKSVNGIYLFRKTKDIVVKDPLHEIEKIGKRHSLGKSHVEGVQQAYEHEQQNNLYSVINGFTRYATDNLKNDYKNRLKFETIANDILEKVA